MKILNGYPPIYDKADAVFKLRGNENRFQPVFAYGDIIYNPHGNDLDKHIIAHEKVHGRQQEISFGPAWWWDQYLKSPGFRLSQEIPAYRAQYASFCADVKDREARHKYLHWIAKDLGSEMYGGIISIAEAKRQIKNESC